MPKTYTVELSEGDVHLLEKLAEYEERTPDDQLRAIINEGLRVRHERRREEELLNQGRSRHSKR